MNQETSKFNIHHVGYVVKDLEGAVEHFKDCYGLNEFKVYDFVPSKVWSYGKEVFGYKLRIAMSAAVDGKAGVEIIQPIGGEGVHKDFLTNGGEGLHHVCISVDNDYDAWREKFVKKGYRFVFESETEDDVIGFRRCFYAEDPVTSMIIEIKETPYFRK
jgi:catechol 2,3-dioxygenase-like lactoylglutathione lyase family enzyme